jgi:hypothetical protein
MNGILKAAGVSLVLAVAPAVRGEALMAQNQHSPSRVPVTVALSLDTIRVQGPFIILRGAGGTPRDVIALRADLANAQSLSQAVFMLAAARRENGDTAQASYRLRGSVKDPPGKVAREIPWAAKVIADLRNAETQPVPDLGMTRAVEIWLPPQRGNGRSSAAP